MVTDIETFHVELLREKSMHPGVVNTADSLEVDLQCKAGGGGKGKMRLENGWEE